MASSGDQALAWLEAACAALATDPKPASDALLAFRKEPHALDVSRHVLFSPGVRASAAVQHQACAALQQAGLDRWEVLSESDRLGLVRSCWERAHAAYAAADAGQALDGSDGGGGLPRVVRASLLQTCAMFWKRGWPLAHRAPGAWPPEAKTALFQTLNEVISRAQEAPLSALAAAELLTALVVDFGSTKANALGLPLEFHRAAHAAFESERCLLETLRLGMDLLARAVQNATTVGNALMTAASAAQPDSSGGLAASSSSSSSSSSARSALQLLRGAAVLCSELLAWQHGALDPWATPGGEAMSLKLPVDWRDAIVRPEFLGAIFDAYKAARVLPFALSMRSATGSGGGGSVDGLGEAAHELLQLLIMLASVTGPIFGAQGSPERAAYAGFMFEGALGLVEEPLDSVLLKVAGRGAALQQVDATVDATTGAATPLHVRASSRHQLVQSALLLGQWGSYSNLREAVASDVSNTAVLVRRLVSTFSLPVLAQTTSFSASSLNRLATATANSLAQAVAEAEASDRADSLDGPWRLTCADKLMEAWASLAAAAAMAEVHRSAHGPEVFAACNAIRQVSGSLYLCSLHARLACAAADARHQAAVGDDDDDDDDDEGLGEEAETADLREALEHAAWLGRLSLPTSLPALASLLASAEPLRAAPQGVGDISSFAAALSAAVAGAAGAAGGGSSSSSSMQVALMVGGGFGEGGASCLTRIRTMHAAGGSGPCQHMCSASGCNGSFNGFLDCVQVLVLAAGYLLADNCDGEVPMLPEPILHACCQPSSSAGVEKNGGGGGPAFATAAFAVAAASISAGGGGGGTEGDLEAQGAVINVASAVWAYLEAELDLLMASPHDDARSPLIAETLLWFGERFSATYLEPDPNEYPPHTYTNCSLLVQHYGTPSAPPPAAAAAGGGDGGSATVANVLLRAISAYGATWPHERQLMAQSCKLLKALGRPRQWYEGCANDGDGGRASHPYGGMPACVRLEPYSQLLVRHGASLDPQAQTTPGGDGGFPSRLASDLRAPLFDALLSGALSSCKDEDALPRLECLMGPLERRLQTLVAAAEAEVSAKLAQGGSSSGGGEGVLSVALVEAMVQCVCLYQGACQAVTGATHHRLSQRVVPALQPLAHLMALAVNPASCLPAAQLSAASPYVVARLVADPSIAEPFLKFAKHFAESFLPLSGPRDTLTFFDFCQKALTTYAGAAQSTVSMQRRPPPLSSLSASTPSSPRGGGADGGAAATESFLFADVEECLELLQLLAVKDVVDFASPSEEEQASLPQVDCAGVVFFGLQTVLPLISAELLQVPQLCSAYFALVGHLASDHAHRFVSLPPPLALALATSLDTGIKHDNGAVSRESLRGVEGLASYMAEQRMLADPAHQLSRGGAPSQLAARAAASGGSPEARAAFLGGGAFAQWCKEVVQLVVFHDAVWDRLDAAADALFALLCAESDRIEPLVTSILASVSEDPASEKYQRLAAAFTKLLTLNAVSFASVLSRQARFAFRKNVKLFVSETRAFLRVM